MEREAILSWIRAHRTEIIRDLFSLVRVPSVSDPESAVKPFGKPCQDVLDTMYRLADRDGYAHDDFERAVGRIHFHSTEGPSYGIWSHLDVVPVPNPEDWVYPPFEGTMVEDRYLIGRGIQDNKMTAIAVFHVMNCLRDLGYTLRRDWSLFLGTSEENGMNDIRMYLSRHTAPDVNLVPDCGFPVCVAQRGSQTLRYRLALSLKEGERISFRCGSHISVTPETVTAQLPDGRSVQRRGHGYHIIKADDDNAVLHMLEALEQEFPARSSALRELRELLSSVERMGISYEDEDSGPLMARPTRMGWEAGELWVDVFSVIPVSGDVDRILSRAQAAAETAHARCERLSARPPYRFRRDHPLVETLSEVYREVTGDPAEPFIMTGGNYAALLPNALGYGPGMPGRVFPEHIFSQGHGDYHQCDESEDWEHIAAFMEIYARAILRLDGEDGTKYLPEVQ